MQSTTIQGCKQRQKRRWEKTCHKERKVNTKMKVTLRMNTLMKARVEMITFRVMPMKIMFPHPSAFQRDKFFFYNQTAKSDTIGGEHAERHCQFL